jgi:predicted nuclease of predicted toxin-antitoxin system
MKFLVDAQLPSVLCNILLKLDHQAIHVLELANEDRSTDKEIRDAADRENRIIITKDSDFYHSHMTIQTPIRLLLITTGNISNKVLFDLIRTNIAKIENLFQTCDLVELSNNEIVGH